jgi:glutamyl-tRNA reductase
MLKFYLASWSFKDDYRLFENASSRDLSVLESALDKAGIGEFVILSTCNRLEVYSTHDFTGIEEFKTAEFMRDRDAVEHLFRVSSGLESMSVGEQEILRQTKEAYLQAMKASRADKMISVVFRKAISVGKKVRETTNISKGKVSLAAQTAEILNSYSQSRKRVMIIGTGKMATSVAKYLRKLSPESMTICGRTESHAARLAASIDADYIPLDNVDLGIEKNDVIIAVTSSKDYIITPQNTGNSIGSKVFIDLSNPRNIDPAISEYGCTLIDLEHIQPIIEKNMDTKREEVKLASRIVSDELDIFSKTLLEMEAEDFISDIYLFSKLIEKEASDQLIHEVSKGVPLDQAVSSMANSLVNKILAPHTLALKSLIRDHGNDLMEETLRRFHRELRDHYEDYLKKSEGRRASQNQRDQTPQLAQRP